MLIHKVKKTDLPFKLTSQVKMARFQTFWIQMRKNKPFDKSRKTEQTSGTKMVFYSYYYFFKQKNFKSNLKYLHNNAP
ncbi:hypothetical protein Hanom_Chr09g00763001 [Helianthus anomalus]